MAADWISVNEKLPPIGKRVLLSLNVDLMVVGWRVETQDGWAWADNTGNFVKLSAMPNAPTHWMPLPPDPVAKSGAGRRPGPPGKR